MFHSARLKLSLWYLFTILVISSSFSIIIYQMLTREVNRFAQMQKIRLERRFVDNGQFVQQLHPLEQNLPPLWVDPELVKEIKERLLFQLVIMNGVIVGVAGGFGYILAGKTLRPIKKMVEEQERFVTDSSHELRTPLTALKSLLEVNLRNKKITLAQAQKTMKEGLEEVNRMQILSDRLLELAQFQQVMANSIEKVSLLAITTKAIEQVSPIAKQKKIKIENKTNSVELETSVANLTEVLVILLENAIKYSQPQTHIVVSSQINNSKLNIFVKDQGMGINQKDLAHIFDRFYRADQSRTKGSTSGYGLGLAIAKQIIESFRGTMTVSSVVGKGSTFVIVLPLRQTA